MTHAPIDPAKLKRQKRLEETLRENLRRRKEQARGRTEAPSDADAGDDGQAPVGDDA